MKQNKELFTDFASLTVNVNANLKLLDVNGPTYLTDTTTGL